MQIRILPAIAALALLSLSPAFSQTVTKPSTANATTITQPPAPLLPVAFDGWLESAKPATGTNPAQADAANAAALNEYGLTRFAIEHYTRNADTLTVKALQFPDSTGAFGAFTFYRSPNMAPEDIGSTLPNQKLGRGGASDNTHILFWAGTILVDAQFSRVNAMTLSEMRDLAKMLPPSGARELIPPPLPRYLPIPGLDPTSIRYALGPSAYQAAGGVLPASQVGFDRSAEAITANYNINGGDGTLTLIEYPSAPIAGEAEKALTALIASVKNPGAPKPASDASQALPAPLTGSSLTALAVHRSGPIVAITSGALNDRQAQLLLGSVHYDADITWNNTQGYIPETTKAARLLVNIILGSSIICLFALALGIGLGGGRALIRKLRGKSASAMDETMEIIKLHLNE